LSGSIATAGLAPGRHTVYVRARDVRPILQVENVSATNSAAVPVTMFVRIYATRGSLGPRKGAYTLALSQ
jgi:hypothetical protein